MNAIAETTLPSRLGFRAPTVARAKRRRAAGAGLLGVSVAAMLGAALKLRSVRRSPRKQAGLSGAALTAFALGLNQFLNASRRDSALGEVTIDRSITIRRSPRDVYAYWRELEHLPEFMVHLESVKVTDGVSVWTTNPSVGARLEWRAEITQDVEGEGFSWCSRPGAPIANCGAVRFTNAPGGRGTEVRLHLEYQPPGGAVGRAFARLFRGLPAAQFESDLRRLKQILETGEVVHSDASVHRGLHAARPLQGKFSPQVSGKAST
jgi:uncharacterized membrane protein